MIPYDHKLESKTMNKEQVTEVLDFLKKIVFERFELVENPPQPSKNEWEVVEFTSTVGIITNYDNDDLKRSYEKWFNTFIIHPDFWKITKICRLSDKFPLEVGKEYEIKSDKLEFTGIISSFTKNENEIIVRFKTVDILTDDITYIVECKEQLATTSDDYPVYDMQKIWQVDNSYNLYQAHYCKEWWDNEKDDTVALFNIEKSAIAFIHDHKPDKSLAMIRKALAITGYGAWRDSPLEEIMQDIETGLAKLKNNQ